MIGLVSDNPAAVADLLIGLGFTPDLLIDEARLPVNGYANDYISRKYM